MKQNGYQNAAFGCFALIALFTIIVSFYRGDNDLPEFPASLSATLHPFLISDFFSAPLANQKKARYNMTRRTEMVIFKEGATLAFTDLRD